MSYTHRHTQRQTHAIDGSLSSNFDSDIFAASLFRIHSQCTHTIHDLFFFSSSLSGCVCIKYSLEQNHFTTLNSIMSDFAMCSICHLLGMFFFSSSRCIRRFCRISFRLVGKSVERRHKCIFNSPFSISIYCFDH